MLRTLRGSTALLTGASRGLGALVARRLAAEGMDLVLAARDEAKLETVRNDCARAGGRVLTVAADVSRSADREALVRQAGQLDVLINNAAVEYAVPLVDQTSVEVEAQIATNLVAPVELIRLVLPQMLARRAGVIVNVSSMSGKAATPYNAVYAATKFGLSGLTRSLRVELEGSGVHVGAVYPSFVVESGMWSETGVAAPRLLGVRPEKVVRAVLAVIRGASEVLVTSGPVRPLLALREMLPNLEAGMLRSTGAVAAFRARSAAVRRPRAR